MPSCHWGESATSERAVWTENKDYFLRDLREILTWDQVEASVLLWISARLVKQKAQFSHFSPQYLGIIPPRNIMLHYVVSLQVPPILQVFLLPSYFPPFTVLNNPGSMFFLSHDTQPRSLQCFFVTRLRAGFLGRSHRNDAMLLSVHHGWGIHG